MLSEFLNTVLTPHVDPARASETDLNVHPQSIRSDWSDWCAPVSTESPCGADCSYDDDFLGLKDEVAKLSDIDETLIIDTADRLLRDVTKDVRVAVYYVYGRMRRDGAAGVSDAIERLAALVERFGDALLPARAETRKAAFEWLSGATFGARFETVQDQSGKHLAQMRAALARIVAAVETWPDSARPDMSALFRRVDLREQAADGSIVAASGVSPANENRASVAAEAKAEAAASESIASNADLLERSRQLAQYLRSRPDGTLAASRLLRCVRWDTLTVPPPHDTTGRTRLAAPRDELRTQLSRLAAQRQWSELTGRVEAAFAEGANHFWLDLQRYAFLAWQAESAGALCERLANDCALLMDRVPDLDRLSFSDGTPFADAATREWIATHASVRDVERGAEWAPVAVASPVTDWAEAEAQAQALATHDSIDAALGWLQRLSVPDGERERFVRYLLMARVAERAGRADTALHLLTRLDSDARRFDLAAWEPSLAFEAWHQLLRLLRWRAGRKDADRVALAVRIDGLLCDLTSLDPTRAFTLAAS
ncbi:type VI secretion system protein TssA [Paraburkholderia sp.]|uniref:type VI secretion system protein TssA n=1 Tax=Paraburkholderia sp. TaxID=1926495 RepID=UPI00238EE4D2|nr:type VI secretion system protein TssA [Paraburkholderia sp.]MDE1180314.1 type VI secretion system protein TssA [Paraburkholderia sp.]